MVLLAETIALAEDHSAEVLAEDHSVEVLAEDHSAEVLAEDHSAEVLAEDHSAEATVDTPEVAVDIAEAVDTATEDVVKTRTSAFIIRCTSFILHEA